MDEASTIICRVCRDDRDREEALRIRLTVFVDEQKVPAELEPDEYDSDALHLVAADPATGLVLGTARIVAKGGGVAKIGRVAVLEPHRGRGIGRLLMIEALRQAQAAGHTSAILDAQLPVIPFYEKLGFVAEGPEFEDAGIAHRRMTLPIAP